MSRPARAERDLWGHAELRAGVVLLDYLETLDGQSLDREQGVVPALAAEVEAGWRRAFGRLALRFAGGSVDYSGQVQDPNDPGSAIAGVWAHGQSIATQLEAHLQGGALVDPAHRVGVFAGAGLRQWQRSIQSTTVNGYPVAGLNETYGWWELELGARVAILADARDDWEVEAAAVQTVAPRIQVSYQGSNLTLDLGARLGWRAGTTFRHEFAPPLFVVAGLWGEGYRFGASAPKPVGGGLEILEPDSRTFRFGLELGVGARF